MFVKDGYCIPGWIILALTLAIYNFLPAEIAEENGFLETMQLFWISLGMALCLHHATHDNLPYWGGRRCWLFGGGALYFFLLFMREISWGRVLFTNPDGSFYTYEQLGIAEFVHPFVAFLIVMLLVCLWKGNVVSYLKNTKIPLFPFLLCLAFIFVQWLGEKSHLMGAKGEVLEELDENGAYFMMLYLVYWTTKRLKRR